MSFSPTIDDRRHLDVRQGFDHARILLREHAAAGAREARGVAMPRRGAFGASTAERAKSFLLIALRSAQRVLVPALRAPRSS